MPNVSIPLPAHAYTVHIGPGMLTRVGPELRRIIAPRRPRLFTVTSPEIWRFWQKPFLDGFKRAKLEPPATLFLEPGERHKRLRSVEALLEQLAKQGADRDTVLIAFGGGVIGDLTGFLAAIYMRGIPFVQVPTTFLAQVDSSVGGKTGVNLAAGKNLVGSFHHPLAVFADIDTLATLPARELRAGLQETVKAAIIRSPTLFRTMEKRMDDLLPRKGQKQDTALLTKVIADSVRIKAEVVLADERESNLRMILNFGHTLGHAIESATAYKLLLHGEAVGWGQLAALHIAHRRGMLPPQDAVRIEALIQRATDLPAFHTRPERLVALTAADKKNRSGMLRFILPTGIGTVVIVNDVSHAELLAAAEHIVAEANAAARTTNSPSKPSRTSGAKS
jgi:3-dehydroquinate synthase